MVQIGGVNGDGLKAAIPQDEIFDRQLAGHDPNLASRIVSENTPD